MESIILDRSSGIPVYRQLAEFIQNQITSGVYRSGDILPSEADYIRDLSLSRTTVRLAFGLVANAGLVRREQGRGTIVVSQIRSSLPVLSGFTEEALRFKRKPGVHLLCCEEAAVTPDVMKALLLPENTHILRVKRLRLVDDEPIGLTLSWFNTLVFPEIRMVDFTHLSIYDLIENQLGLTILSAIENIRADIASDFEANKLEVKHNSPVLRMKRTTLVQPTQGNPIPIEYVDAVFNGAAYSVDVELYRHKRATASIP